MRTRRLLKAADVDRLLKAMRHVQAVRLAHDDRLTFCETFRFMHVEASILELVEAAQGIPFRDSPPEDCPVAP